MVLRYWGDDSAYAEDYASLVDQSAGGIHTSALVDAVHRRGWQGVATSATDSSAAMAAATAAAASGRPVIVLIEDRPGVFHYVVLAGFTSTAVIFHDPARAPFRIVTRQAFDRQWQAAGRWMFIIDRPGHSISTTELAASASADPATTEAGLSAPDRCQPLIGHAVLLAQQGERADAEQELRTAATLCPASSDSWRELAGLRFVQKRYAEAGTLAERATRLEPTDTNAWQILASSQYLRGRPIEALAAWNKIGLPHLTRIDVIGARRTRHPVVVAQTGLSPNTPRLTAAAFARAELRLAELPVAASTALRYEPHEDTVSLRAFVTERRALPEGLPGWIAAGLRAAVLGEVRGTLPGLAGDGEIWTMTYRWADRRPRASVAFEVPTPGVLPGTTHVDFFWERQSYAATLPETTFLRETRRRASASVADWATHWLRWEGGGSTDRIGDRQFLSAFAATNLRLAKNHVALIVRGERWAGRDDAESFTAGDVLSLWRSTKQLSRPVWRAAAGLLTASTAAPFAVWPGASTGKGRDVLLRAHPLLQDNVITGETFGRRLLHASVEREAPLTQNPYASLSGVVFVDTARAFRARNEVRTPRLHVDVGGGIRIDAPGSEGRLRVDVGYGLRDGAVSVSAGYQTRWGWP
jgi:tetratricopeptide (TPR) repeat protein